MKLNQKIFICGAFIALTTFIIHHAYAQNGFNVDTVYIDDNSSQLLTGNHFLYFVDSTSSLDIQEINHLDHRFILYSKDQVPNFGLTDHFIWLKTIIKNTSKDFHVFIRVAYPLLSEIELYYYDSSTKKWVKQISGEKYISNKQDFLSNQYTFQIPFYQGESKTVYIRTHSFQQMLYPVYVGTFNKVMSSIYQEKLVFYIYVGIILAIFFYNLFVFISTADSNYFYYIIYVLFVFFAQFSLLGYSAHYLWPGNAFFIKQGVNISGILSGISVALFVKNFLRTKSNSPFFDRFLWAYIILYLACFIPIILGQSSFTYQMVDILSSTGSLLIWIIGINFTFKKIKEAKYFLIAWTIFIFSVIIFVLKDFGLFPYDFYTKNVMLLGSAIETILISLALADKINTYKLEKEQAQAAALLKSEELRTVLSHQNITLERMVQKRTEDLERANIELKQALKNLQEAEVQLVQAEKMATLGQLTAGIAHEINNPINFVKSNIRPLQMDLQDMLMLIHAYEKKLHALLPAETLEEVEAIKRKINYPALVDEIRTLLKGIEEGAERTAEIIRGLRIFSRLDESELKKADLHECIDSTLVLLRTSIPDYVQVEKHYGQLPLIECYPGKLNQMLMNLLTNAIHAVKSKNPKDPEGEKIIITTAVEPDGQHIRISIADTGIGMTPEVKQKIFEPFFTTKEVGEGTGLGLPIVYSIVEKHAGHIFVETTFGKGSEFIIILPITPKTVASTPLIRG
ncbi:MAG: GHKL domain-containing protein [Thermoflavifilum sp.]|nr:GHKL domain-containing protein [Thermoflavifilum sp.]